MTLALIESAKVYWTPAEYRAPVYVLGNTQIFTFYSMSFLLGGNRKQSLKTVSKVSSMKGECWGKMLWWESTAGGWRKA